MAVGLWIRPFAASYLPMYIAMILAGFGITFFILAAVMEVVILLMWILFMKEGEKTLRRKYRKVSRSGNP